MKVNCLSKDEKAALADFYEGPQFKSLHKVMADVQMQWAQLAVSSPSMEDLRELRGKISALKELADFLEKNHKTNSKV